MKLPDDIKSALRANTVVSEVLERWDEVALPDAWLVAGAVVQSYWNAAHDFDPMHGIGDIDIVYFDAQDTSETAEASQASRVSALFESVNVRFDVKNQARVHLWYEGRFGVPTTAYTSPQQAIDTFPTTAGAIGVRPAADTLEVYASFAFDDLLNLVVRPNKRLVTADVYSAKVERWRALWPRLEIIAWEDA